MGLFNKIFKKNKNSEINKLEKKSSNKSTREEMKINKALERSKKFHQKQEKIDFENMDNATYQKYKTDKKKEIFDEEKEIQKGETLKQSQKRLEKEIRDTSSSVSFVNGKAKAAETAPIKSAKSSSLRTVRYEILNDNAKDFETRGKQFMNCEGQSKKYIQMCGEIDYYKKEGRNLEKALDLCHEATNYLLNNEWGTDDKFARAFLKGKPIIKNGKIIGCGAAALEIKLIEKKISERTQYYQVYKRNNKRCKQGFNYVYEYFENYKLKTLSSVDIDELEKKVKSKNLHWELLE